MDPELITQSNKTCISSYCSQKENAAEVLSSDILPSLYKIVMECVTTVLLQVTSRSWMYLVYLFLLLCAHAKMIVSLLKDLQENDQRVTMLQLVDKLKVKQKGIDPELKRDELEQLVIQLILEHVLKEEFQHTAYATNAYATVGPLSNYVLHGKKTTKLEVSTGQKCSSSIKKQSKRTKSADLEVKLDELRKELASINGGIFPHSVLSTQQISMLSVQRPKSVEQLEKVIGKLKTEKYGARILEEIEIFESNNQSNNILESEISGASKKMKSRKTPVIIESSEDEA